MTKIDYHKWHKLQNIYTKLCQAHSYFRFISTGLYTALTIKCAQRCSWVLCLDCLYIVHMYAYHAYVGLKGLTGDCFDRTETVPSSDVKSSRPKWPWGQNFGLGLEALASASKIWPWPGLDTIRNDRRVVLLCNRAFFGQKSCKIRAFC